MQTKIKQALVTVPGPTILLSRYHITSPGAFGALTSLQASTRILTRNRIGPVLFETTPGHGFNKKSAPCGRGLKDMLDALLGGCWRFTFWWMLMDIAQMDIARMHLTMELLFRV